MNIRAKVKPSTSRNDIRRRTDGSYEIFVTAAPEKGKANLAAIELLADMFDVRKSLIRIVKGKTSKNKVFAIGE